MKQKYINLTTIFQLTPPLHQVPSSSAVNKYMNKLIVRFVQSSGAVREMYGSSDTSYLTLLTYAISVASGNIPYTYASLLSVNMENSQQAVTF